MDVTMDGKKRTFTMGSIVTYMDILAIAARVYDLRSNVPTRRCLCGTLNPSPQLDPMDYTRVTIGADSASAVHDFADSFVDPLAAAESRVLVYSRLGAGEPQQVTLTVSKSTKYKY
jgi:hypothetical protein